jgi:hypothetical protein
MEIADCFRYAGKLPGIQAAPKPFSLEYVTGCRTGIGSGRCRKMRPR